MSDIRDLLEREVTGLRPPPSLEPVHRRARQRQRRRRLGSAIVAFAVAGAGTAGAWLAVSGLRHTAGRTPATGAPWDGGRIVYPCGTEAGATGFGSDLCTMQPDGSDRGVLLAAPTTDPRHSLTSLGDATWSPDGSHIVYRLSDPDACDRCSDLLVAGSDGSGVRRLTSGAQASMPAWSPDGSTIAFATVGGSIDTVRADGTDLTTLTPCTCNGGRLEGAWPAWSPDGTRIAFVQFAPGADADMWVMNADGSDLQRVVTADEVGGSIAQPAWGPDGVLIAFVVQESNGSSWIWAIDARLVGDPKDVPHRWFGDEARSWAPQWIDGGARVAFLHGSGRPADLLAIRADRGGYPIAATDTTPASPLDPPPATLVPDFPGEQFSFQPPPGGAAGACLEPGPPWAISCSDALLLTNDLGGPQGSKIDVRLVQGSIEDGPSGSVSSDGRWVWAIIYRDIQDWRDCHQPGCTPSFVRIDFEIDFDARTGAFVSEGKARSEG